MSTVKVNKIEKRSGSILTLGGPGTAVTLACGATQTGFGRTGTAVSYTHLTLPTKRIV